MSEAGSLWVDLGLNSAKFQEGMAKATKAMSDFEKSVKPIVRGFNKFGKQMEGMGESMSKNLTLPLIGAGVAIGAAVTKMATFGSEINDMAVRTGFSRESLQELKFAADQTGVSMESIEGSTRRLTKSMGEAASGQGNSAKLFEQLGVSIKNADGSLRPANEVFADTLGQLGKIPDEATRNVIAMDLLGKSAGDLTPLIKEGKEGLNRFAKEARDAGLVMSEEAVIAADEFGDKMDKLRDQLGHAGMEIGQAFMPVIEQLISFMQTSVVPTLKKVADWFKGLSTEQKNWVVGIAGAVAAIGPLFIIIGKLSGGIGTLVGLVPKVASAFTFLAGPIGIAIGAIVAVGAAAVALYSHFTRLDEVTNSMADAMDEAKKSAAGEIGELDTLIGTAQNAALSTDKRAAAVQELQDKYPDYLGNISKESIMNGDAALQVDILRKSILRLAEAKAIQGKIDELAAKRAEAVLSNGESELTLIDKTVALFSNYGYANTKAALANQRLGETTKATEAEIAKLQSKLAEYNDVTATTVKNTDEIVKKNDTLNVSLSKSHDELSKVKFIVEEVDDSTADFSDTISKVDHTPVITGGAIWTNYKSTMDMTVQTTSQAVDQLNGQWDRYKAKLDEVSAKMNNIASIAGGIFGGITSIFNESMTNQTIALDNRFGHERELIENSQMTEEKKTQALKELGEREAAERKKLMQKKAKMDKAGALFSAIISGAQAVVAALALGPPAGIVLAAIVGGLAAAQIAMIASRPIPQFAEGGLVMGETMGIVGEGRGTSRSNPEVIAPLDKLMGMLPQGGGGLDGKVEFIISGESLRAVLKKNDTSRRFLGNS